jgi:hypothetical protein
MLLGVGTELRARRQRLAWILLRNHPKLCNFGRLASDVPK